MTWPLHIYKVCWPQLPVGDLTWFNHYSNVIVRDMASNFISHSSIPLTAASLSAGFLGLGALHFSTPFQLCEFFGVPSSPDESGELGTPSPLPFIYANGGREMMLGTAFWIMGRQWNQEGINALLYGMFVCVPHEKWQWFANYADWITKIDGSTGRCVCGLGVWREVWRLERTVDHALTGRVGCRANCMEWLLYVLDVIYLCFPRNKTNASWLYIMWPRPDFWWGITSDRDSPTYRPACMRV